MPKDKDISVILTTGGTYNVIGIEDGMFFLQGNLRRSQLADLMEAIDAELNPPANASVKA